MQVIFKQDVKNLLKNKPIMFYLVAYPPLLVFLIGTVFKSMFNNSIVNAYDYYGVTMIIFLTLATVIILPELMFGSHVKEANFRVILSPTTRPQIYFSKILAAMVVTYPVFALYILLFNDTGLVNFGGQNLWHILLLEFSLLTFSITFGGAFCTLLKDEDLATKILNLVVNIIAALSGVFFPAYILEKTFATISSFSPISIVISAFYSAIYDNSINLLYRSMVILIMCSAAFVLIIQAKYHPETTMEEN